MTRNTLISTSAIVVRPGEKGLSKPVEAPPKRVKVRRTAHNLGGIIHLVILILATAQPAAADNPLEPRTAT